MSSFDRGDQESLKESKPFISIKEVVELLEVNENMIYTLVSDKRLPATKVTEMVKLVDTIA